MQEKVRNRKACVAINRDGSTGPNRYRSCYLVWAVQIFWTDQAFDWPRLLSAISPGEIRVGAKIQLGCNFCQGAIIGVGV